MKKREDFKHARTSSADNERSGRPTTTITTDNIHQMVLDNYWIKIRKIAKSVSISKECVYHILTEELGMRKLTPHWMPRLLTVDQKHIRMNISKALLEWFKQNESEFLCRLINVYETWIYHFSWDKGTAKRWIAKGEPVSKKAAILKKIIYNNEVLRIINW